MSVIINNDMQNFKQFVEARESNLTETNHLRLAADTFSSENTSAWEDFAGSFMHWGKKYRDEVMAYLQEKNPKAYRYLWTQVQLHKKELSDRDSKPARDAEQLRQADARDAEKAKIDREKARENAVQRLEDPASMTLNPIQMKKMGGYENYVAEMCRKTAQEIASEQNPRVRAKLIQQVQNFHNETRSAVMHFLKQMGVS